MKKIIIAVLLIFFTLNASVFKYEHGLIKDTKNLKFALGVVDISQVNYIRLSREEAINELAKKLYSEVTLNTTVNKALKEDKEYLTYYSNYNIKSNLSLIGIEIKDKKEQDNKYYTLVEFDLNKNKDVYKKAINRKAKIINNMYLKVKSLSRDDKIYMYKEILKEIEVYNKYFFISTIIGIDNLIKPKITSYNCSLELMKLERQASKTLEGAVTKLIQNLNLKGANGTIKVLPVTYNKKSNFSLFSADVQSELIRSLSKKYNIVSTNSDYIISGYYYIDDDNIILYIYLYGKGGNILSISSAKLAKSKKISYYKPQLIKDDNKAKLSNNLTLLAKINSSTQHQLFRDKENVYLEVYASKECYIYAIDTFMKNGREYQVLLPLKAVNNQYDKSQFEFKVTTEEKRKFINFGNFEVAPPFGEERLTFIASTKSILASMKVSYKKIDNIEYAVYKINGNIVKDTINQTRGLVKAFSKSKEFNYGEYSIKFTTVANGTMQ